MSNTKTIKIILNLRQLENGSCGGGGNGCGGSGGGCGDDAGGSSCCNDSRKAIEAARERGRQCGAAGGGCVPMKPEFAPCPSVKETCQQPPAPPPSSSCQKKAQEPPPKKEGCGKKEEAPSPSLSACQQKKAAKEEPKKEGCPKKPEPPPKKEGCSKKPEAPPKKEGCPKKPEAPPKKPTCPQKKEPEKKECPKPPEKMCLTESPKKCAPPKYINTDVGPDGKEQKCKEGTSAEAKCRNMGQQRGRGDEYPNPASSGGMLQFFKDRFYDSTRRW